jgi:hypothetical protein
VSKAKCVLVAALVLLCAGLMSGAALAADAWAVVSQDLPTSMVWDDSAGGWAWLFALAENTGTTTWDSSYSMVSVMGVTAAASPIDRWGVTGQASGVVPPGNVWAFGGPLTGPPITTLKYELPFSPTAAGVDNPFDNNWMLANGSDTLIITDAAEQATTVSRFPDDQPGTAGGWARFWIEELAGRVPLVVSGYPDGTYRPAQVVTRDQMAVYMARALNLDLEDFEGFFSDVDDTQWAWPWIEALVRSNVVQGYPDGTYRPGQNVSRGQMAVYVARGIYGELTVPSGPEVGHFSDVPDRDPGPVHPFYDFIEFTVAQHVVNGHPDGTYRPDANVTRDQMAVFVYKGFVMPTGSIVILGGPAVTNVDPWSLPNWYEGWSSSTLNPICGYFFFDAARLRPEMAPLEITAELRGPLWASDTQIRDASYIEDALDFVATTGDPYWGEGWTIDPFGFLPGDYEFVITINGHEVSRTAPFTLENDCWCWWP